MRRANRWLPAVAMASIAAIALVVLPPGLVGEERGVLRATAQDVISIGKDVVIGEPVSGDVIVVGASATIDSAVSGNAVVFGGTLRFGSSAEVSGDVLCLGGAIEGVNPERVGGEIVAPGSLAGVASLASDRALLGGTSSSLLALAVKLSLLVAWLFAAVAVTLVAGREVRASSLELRASTFHVLLLGLVAFTSLVLTAIVFSYLVPYVVGIFLLAILGAFAIIAKIYGMVVVFHAIGSGIAGAKDRDDLERRRWLRGDLAMTLLGLLILGAVRMIPVVGTIVWMGASLFGLGVALATKFGRREPWFLAYRLQS